MSKAQVALINEMLPKTKPEVKRWTSRREYLELRKKVHARPSKSPPCLITIAPREGIDFGNMRPKKVKDKYQVSYGSHATIGCFFGWLYGDDRACIALFYPPLSDKYVRVGISRFEDDMIATINHESLHHALMWLADDQLSQTYDQIDNIVDSLQTAKRLGL